MDRSIKNEVDLLLREIPDCKVTIALDWLSLYFTHKTIFEQNYTEGDQIKINEDCYLLEINRPTLHFHTHFVLFYKKEECAHLLLNSRNKVFFKEDVVKIEFSNHTLYSGIWMDVYDSLIKFGLKYKGPGRIDIAIDGVNYIQQLLNIYAKQTVRNRTIILKNSSEIRARFSAKVLNTKTMLFENFNIGAAGGTKMVTVYNKSLEIVKSGKTYIQEFWKRNGILTEVNDLDYFANEIKRIENKGVETFYLKGFKNIYRFELRLKAEAINEIDGFSIDMLKKASGLADIVKTHCRKYFEMCFNDSRNIARCTSFDILPYDKLNATVINKIARVEKDGVYKAKILIHGLVLDLYKGYTQNFNTNEIIETIMDRVAKYRLTGYLDNKMSEWDAKYRKFIDPDRLNDVTIIINRIIDLNNSLVEDTADIAERHNQPLSTAGFQE